MEHLVEKREIDPYYIQYIVDTDDENIIDNIIDDSVIKFRNEGFVTAVITEPFEETFFMVKCAAFKVTKKNETMALSQTAELEMSDNLGLNSTLKKSKDEPKLVSFESTTKQPTAKVKKINRFNS